MDFFPRFRAKLREINARLALSEFHTQSAAEHGARCMCSAQLCSFAVQAYSKGRRGASANLLFSALLRSAPLRLRLLFEPRHGPGRSGACPKSSRSLGPSGPRSITLLSQLCMRAPRRGSAVPRLRSTAMPKAKTQLRKRRHPFFTFVWLRALSETTDMSETAKAIVFRCVRYVSRAAAPCDAQARQMRKAVNKLAGSSRRSVNSHMVSNTLQHHVNTHFEKGPGAESISIV